MFRRRSWGRLHALSLSVTRVQPSDCLGPAWRGPSAGGDPVQGAGDCTQIRKESFVSCTIARSQLRTGEVTFGVKNGFLLTFLATSFHTGREGESWRALAVL